MLSKSYLLLVLMLLFSLGNQAQILIKGSASHPVVLALDDQRVLVAWTQVGRSGKGVYYRLVHLQ